MWRRWVKIWPSNFFLHFLNSFLRWFFCAILFDIKINFHETTVGQIFKFSTKIGKISGNTFSHVIQWIRMLDKNSFFVDSQINFLQIDIKHTMLRWFFVFQSECKWAKYWVYINKNFKLFWITFVATRGPS